MGKLFTEDELNLIVQALEQMPELERSRFMMGTMIGGARCKDEAGLRKLYNEDKAICDENIAKLKEPVQILIGKVINLKRELYPSEQQN